MDLRRWKILKALATNAGILGFGAFAIVEGADPTLVAGSALIILGLLNGMEVSEFMDAWARIQQAQAQLPPEEDRGDQE